MKYLIGHKIIYLLFIVANLALDTIRLSKFGGINLTVLMIKSFVLMLLNYILLKNMLNKSLSPTLYDLEQMLCVCRMLMDLTCMVFREAIIWTPFIALSPIMVSFWGSLALSDRLGDMPIGVGHIAFFLLIIEVIYFGLLARHENRLMEKILTPQKEQ